MQLFYHSAVTPAVDWTKKVWCIIIKRKIQEKIHLWYKFYQKHVLRYCDSCQDISLLQGKRPNYIVRLISKCLNLRMIQKTAKIRKYGRKYQRTCDAWSNSGNSSHAHVINWFIRMRRDPCFKTLRK